MTAADVFVRCLEDEGVRRTFSVRVARQVDYQLVQELNRSERRKT
jgi:thiamine pyrophosphate-dependent acetolactate synthase large subunit-like protein